MFQLLLGLADPGNLGKRVDDRGYAVVVDVGCATLGDRFHAHDTFVLGFMRQHGSLDAVADGIDIRHVGLELVVGTNATSIVHLNADVLET